MLSALVCVRVWAAFWKCKHNTQSLSWFMGANLPVLLCALVQTGLAFGQGTGMTLRGQETGQRGPSQSLFKAPFRRGRRCAYGYGYRYGYGYGDTSDGQHPSRRTQAADCKSRPGRAHRR